MKSSGVGARGLAAPLRAARRADKLNFMCRMTFAAIAAAAALRPLGAQQVPGRDLFHFPIGLLAEAPALATAAGGGFWNPATLALPKGDAWLFAATGLDSPIEQGVTGQLGTVAYRVRPGVTAGVSIALATVTDLLRTDTDPQSIGDEIPYRSTIVSAVVATERGPAVLGLAVRRRSGSVDQQNGRATSIDVGATVDRPRGLPFRAGLATFLLSPSRRIERASAVSGLEGYLPFQENDIRAGVSYQLDEGGGDETFVYASGKTGLIEMRGGLARHQEFGYTTNRMRLGVDLRYSRYRVGIAREDGTGGLSASYQFLFSTAIPVRVAP